jgi:hypothetical protein
MAEPAQPGAQRRGAGAPGRGCRRGSARRRQAEDVMSTLERLGEMKTKGILTQEEFDAKKAELLKKLV